MTAEEKREFETLKAKVEALTQERDEKGNTWKFYGDFTRDNRMSRTKLKSLIAAQKVVAEPYGRGYLYKWA